MPGVRVASFDTEGLAVAADRSRVPERLILQALAVGETGADVIALLGVPDAAALDTFVGTLFTATGRHYRHSLILGGNDAAGGHPAVLAQAPIVHARSHRTLSFADIGRTPPHDLEPGAPVFSRDCLEVTIERQGRHLDLFVCHFTASQPGARPLVGPDPERRQRQAEAAAVRQIIEQRFADPATAQWVVLGNLADQPEDDRGLADPNHSLGPLLDGTFAKDLGGPGADRWTHFDLATNSYRRCDHILVSPALSRRNQRSRIDIIRGGLPYRAQRSAATRYPRVGWLSPAASWHCPIAAEINFSGDVERAK
jgi:endonuclease/exonuclease/phosphatase family metal-dependent hydrolase